MTPDTADLLAWYDRHRRSMPWRKPSPDPYQVWLSEIMLQQTTVATVTTRFVRFLQRFPTLEALASASEDNVLEEWAGLGYYARARNLHACAKAVAAQGGFPRTRNALLELPGIGAYTAAAIAAIAFGQPVVPVDGNVERVTARVYAVSLPLPSARARLTELAGSWIEQKPALQRPGDFAQALFDLGATICTPRKPACALCPWRKSCDAFAQGLTQQLPVKAKKPTRPLRYGVHFLVRDETGRILVRRRPPTGLLGGMMEIPGTPWKEAPWSGPEAVEFAPISGLNWHPRKGMARHAFTHFELEMNLWTAQLSSGSPTAGMVFREAGAARAGLPTVMRKLLDLDAD